MNAPYLKNPYTYVFSTDVPYYQCDLEGRIKLSYLLKIVERAAGEHLDFLGLPYERLYQEGIVFLLSRVAVRILDCPTGREHLRVETAPQSPKGAQFHRQIILCREDTGDRLAEIHTAWFLVDPHTRKVLRPGSFKHELATIPDELALPRLAAGRLHPAGEVLASDRFTVRYSHLDVNRHLNNTVYADLVTDLLPFDELVRRGIAEFDIAYRHESRHGEVLDLSLRYDPAQDRYFVTGTRAGEEPGFEAAVRLGPLAE